MRYYRLLTLFLTGGLITGVAALFLGRSATGHGRSIGIVLELLGTLAAGSILLTAVGLCGWRVFLGECSP